VVARSSCSFCLGVRVPRRRGEQVIITQFGDPVGSPVVEPGLHFKVPFIQQANYFDKRFLEWDGSPNQVPTKDKRFIWVDTYARWRIVDPLLFFQRLRDERGAQSRLDDILDGETRNAVARYDLIELVRSSNRARRGPDGVGGGAVILKSDREGARAGFRARSWRARPARTATSASSCSTCASSGSTTSTRCRRTSSRG
jgi:HflC protein